MYGDKFLITYAGQLYIEYGVDAENAWNNFRQKHKKFETESYKLITKAKAYWLDFAIYLSSKNTKYYVATVMQQPHN